jgi:hypothetical protein
MIFLAEEAVEASLYETLVKCLRRSSEGIRPVFEKYCGISDPFNFSFLSHQNFKKFCRDAGLSSSDAAVDLLFSKATNRMRGVSPRLTYSSFIAVLARCILDRNPSLQVDDVARTVVEFVAAHVSKASRLEPLPSAEELLQPDAMAVLTKELGFLRKVPFAMRVC